MNQNLSNPSEGILKLKTPSPGTSIANACDDVLVLANRKKQSFRFNFNDTEVVVHPGDVVEEIVSRWRNDMEAAHEAWINSDEYKQREAEAEKRATESREAIMVADPTLDGAGMREATVPWPKTPKQLSDYIESLKNRSHDYGTCVYAMSMAAEAAFNYIAGELGVSGFQSSCADADFIRRTRSITGPFMILKGEDMLYPQYDLLSRLQSWKPWLMEEAKKKLADGRDAHPNVVAHWETLAAFDPEEEAVSS